MPHRLSWILEGRVASVADGVTITLLASNRQQHKIRLAGIDAPERAQPFALRSKQHLSERAFGKDANADCYKIDRYDRDGEGTRGSSSPQATLARRSCTNCHAARTPGAAGGKDVV